MAPLALISVTAAILRLGKALIVTFVPFALIVASYAVAFLIAPDTARSSFQTHYEGFFSAAAVVLATVLVTLVVQAGLFGSRQVRPAAMLAACYIVLGEFAAMISLSPGLDPLVAHHAFALTVSAGLASLAAVLLIALRLLSPEPPHLVPSDEGRSLLEPGYEPPGALAAAQDTPPIVGAEARATPSLELTPDAVSDLKGLGPLTAGTVSLLLQQSLSNPHVLTDMSKLPGSRWSVLRLGTLRAIVRRMTPDEAARTSGGGPAVVVARVIPGRELAGVTSQLK